MSGALPRVTEILAAVGLGPDLSRVPPTVLEIARQRGSAVHAAIEAHAYGYLDETELTEDVTPRFAGYLKFVAESGHTAIASEFEVVHRAWRYVGHPDRLGWLLGHRAILDWKNTDVIDLPPAARQLAAYRLAWNDMHPDQPVEVLAVVQLRGDGTYRFHEIDTDERSKREQEFLAAATVFHARQEAA